MNFKASVGKVLSHLKRSRQQCRDQLGCTVLLRQTEIALEDFQEEIY